MKVLVIEDEPDLRLVVRLSLRERGFTVLEAAGGADGLDLARTEQPDLVLLDVMMPGMDGQATFEALRADPATGTIPVVFLTAKAMPAELDRLRSLGAAAVLVKPFDPLALAGELEQVVKRRDGTPAASRSA
jgi:CheY-like chemotaxis protein